MHIRTLIQTSILFTAAALALPATSSAQTSGAACIDTDGDGWGWDGSNSCRIEMSATEDTDSSCIDTDGDGWGWNGTASCLINNDAQEPSQTTISCIDTDGDGWGWDGVASCRVIEPVMVVPTIPTMTTFPACTSADSDPDNDGFGWENNQSCIVDSVVSPTPVMPTECSDYTTVAYAEDTAGELSGDRLAPTVLQVGPGTSTLEFNLNEGFNPFGESKYFSISTGPCDTLDSITLLAYAGIDENSFMAIQQGSQFGIADDPSEWNDLSSVLGYRLVGAEHLNQELLADAGVVANLSVGGMGFTIPLPAGTYTLWVRQAGPSTDMRWGINVSRVQ